MITNLKAYKYKRKPFSGKGWKSWVPDGPICGICGRKIKGGTFEEGWQLWGVVVDGGAAWGDEHSPIDGGHMGWFPIGKDCHKRYATHAY